MHKLYSVYVIAKYASQRPRAEPHLKVVLDPLRVKALWDHNDSSLHVKAQGNLGTALFVLFSNRHEELILQQGGAFYVHPEQEAQEKLKFLEG